MLDATFIIFTILTEIRRGVQPSRIWKTFSRFGEPLSPHLPFWLHLCQQAGLLDVSDRYHPSRSVKTWLAMLPKEQARVLLDGWLSFPKNHIDRAARQSLLLRLKQGAALKPRDLRDLAGLQALGITRNSKITAWGKIIVLTFGIRSGYQAWLA